VFSDDFPLLREQLIRAEGVVFGSPVYIDNVTGQMKIFIDRLADAIHYQVLTGKYGCAVATTWSSGGGGVVRYLNHMLNYLGVFTIPGLHVALENDEQAIYRAEEAAEMPGKELVQSIRNPDALPGSGSVHRAEPCIFQQYCHREPGVSAGSV
jgi:multimeric flavodoxin WrbA